jgi:hypothetical protein
MSYEAEQTLIHVTSLSEGVVRMAPDKWQSFILINDMENPQTGK